MPKKLFLILSSVFLLTAPNAEAANKVTVTSDQIKNAKEKAKTIAGQMRISISEIDFRQMCKKGSPFSRKKTWRSNEGKACETPKVAALAIVHCPGISKDFEKSYCWNKAVVLLGKPSSTTQSILDKMDKSNLSEEEKQLVYGDNRPPEDLPPPLPN
ncbi:MAG: hypothetical protein GW748_07990 [Alphaproteobacteria bacterium]|nr:hypothetical protein [Alphaproteobacteria bacterium]NCQ67664.1 hypothetical protein [Alphaproteobacteria bacterium]NCT07574.1 hypothetical protein [Alphaproteobacteria bacterium]